MENSYEHDIKNIEMSRSTKIRMVLLKITLISLAATTGITLGRCSKSKKKDSEQDFEQWQQTYFENNPAFAYCVAPVDEGYWFLDFCYVVFKNCVVQFFNDNLDDAHGVISTLYQDIASGY